MALVEREQEIWRKVQPERSSDGVPQAICVTIRPFPFWLLFASLLIPPIAFVLSFWVTRQVVLVQGGALVVLDVSFWRYRILGERIGKPLGEAEVARQGRALLIEGEKFQLEPGWRDSAEAIVALNAGTRRERWRSAGRPAGGARPGRVAGRGRFGAGGAARRVGG